MANKPQNTAGPDPREAELVEAMVLDSMEYIHGKGAEAIVKELRSSTDTAATMAAIAYKTVRGVAEKNRSTARVDMDMDMMMGVTTECIDMVTEVAEAANQIQPGSNIEQLKEDTLLRVTVLHGEQLSDENGEFPTEMKQAAATDMRDYMSDAGAQKAFDYVNNRAKAEGINPHDMMRAGNESLFGTKNPLAEGVNRGLMEKTIPYELPGSQQVQAAQTSQDPNLTMPDGSPIPTEAELQAQMDAQGLNSPAAPPGMRGYTPEEMGNLDRGGQIQPGQVDAMNQRQYDRVFPTEETPLMQPPKPAGGY